MQRPHIRVDCAEAVPSAVSNARIASTASVMGLDEKLMGSPEVNVLMRDYIHLPCAWRIGEGKGLGADIPLARRAARICRGETNRAAR